MARTRMVREQIEDRGVCDTAVLDAMHDVPRHEFVPTSRQGEAYADYPLPIGHGQTISQPYMVAVMTEALEIDASCRVLEIGTGSGYQCAVLARIAAEVHSIERDRDLASANLEYFSGDRFAHVLLHHGDGSLGWPEAAPFDAIIATCAPTKIPPSWMDQLLEGGRLVTPVGSPGAQSLVRIRRSGDTFSEEHLLGVRFVSLQI